MPTKSVQLLHEIEQTNGDRQVISRTFKVFHMKNAKLPAILATCQICPWTMDDWIRLHVRSGYVFDSFFKEICHVINKKYEMNTYKSTDICTKKVRSTTTLR